MLPDSICAVTQCPFSDPWADPTSDLLSTVTDRLAWGTRASPSTLLLDEPHVVAFVVFYAVLYAVLA